MKFRKCSKKSENSTYYIFKFLFLIFVSLVTISARAQNDNWTQLGMVKFPQNPSVQTTGMGRISHIAFHPTDSNIIYAASASGGLWRSINEGKTWTVLTDALPYTSCASVIVNHKNPKTLYLGTGDANYYGGGNGVYKSYDEGKTWTQMNFGMGNALVVQMYMHPKDTNIIIASTHLGIFKSVNGGGSWVKKSTVTDNYNDLAGKPNSNSGLYVTSKQSFYYSNDFGETWTQKKVSATDTFSSIMIGVSKADSNLVYVVTWRNKISTGKTYFGGVFKSKDGGQNWRLQSNTPQILGYSSDGTSNDGQGGYNLTITVDPKNASNVYVGAINLWKSSDSAKTWRQQSHWAYGVHADKHHYIFSPFNSKKLFIAHDGGLDRSNDTGRTWKTITDGLTASEFYRMGQSKINREKLLGGLQDNGLNYYKDGIFYTIRGGDYGGDFLFDHLDSNYQYFQGGGNKYNLGTFGSTGINGVANGVYDLHRTDSNTMFMGANALFISTNCRANPSSNVKWKQLSDSILHYGTTGTSALASSRTGNNFVYWAKNNGVLYRVDNIKGSSPIFTTLTKPSGVVRQVSTYAKDSNVVYITIGSKIYKSENKGKTWSDITKNLPAMNIVSMEIDDRTNDSSIYVANAFGVFYKNKSKTSWVTISKNLPAIASISDMEVYNDGTARSCIRISTYGRGIWQSALYPYQTQSPVADFSIASTSSEVCPRQYLINDLSSGGVYSRLWNVSPATGYAFTNKTDSSSRIAELTFSKGGIYTITLTVTNGFGSNTTSKSLVITDPLTKVKCNTSTNLLGNYTIGVTNFEFNGIKRSSPYSVYVNPNYEDYSCSDIAVVKPGNKYPVSVTTGFSYNEMVNIYIDYNNDGDFADTNELCATIPFGLGKRNTNITILPSPPVSNTFLRMRVVSDYSSITSACGTLSYGQSEDYALYIDSKKPSVSVTLPKPKVYGQFPAVLKVSEFVGTMDTSKVKFSNAKVVGFSKPGPLQYNFILQPVSPGKIYVNVAANSFKDMVGNLSTGFADSTQFEFGLSSFTFKGLSKVDSIYQTPSGGRIKSYVYAGTRIDSMVATFVVTDSAKMFVSSIRQESGKTPNDFKSTVIYTLKSFDGAIEKEYSVDVMVLKDTTCLIDSFLFKQPNVKGIISETAQTIGITVPFKTDIANILTYIYPSKKGNIWVTGNLHTNGSSRYNFDKPFKIKVIAEDGIHFKEYTVYLNVAQNTECDLISWNIVSPSTTGTIIGDKVTSTLPFKSSLKNLVASFTISDSARLFINSTKQSSGITANNYTDTVALTVVSQDGKHSKIYKVKINITPNNQCELLSFNFTNPAKAVNITQDTVSSKVLVEVAENTDLTNLVAIFSLSDSATAFINSKKQNSGVTSNDFTNPLVYKVLAQNGLKSKDYEVTVKRLVGYIDVKQNLLSIYPNPGTGIFNIKWLAFTPNFTLKVTDIQGKVLAQLANEETIDLSQYQSDVYLLILETNGIRQVYRLVKL